MSADGLECAAMLVATRDALAQEGVDQEHAFVTFVICSDRERVTIAAPSLASVAALVETLNPQIVECAVALHEDEDELLDAIRGHGPGAGSVRLQQSRNRRSVGAWSRGGSDTSRAFGSIFGLPKPPRGRRSLGRGCPSDVRGHWDEDAAAGIRRHRATIRAAEAALAE